MGGSASKRPRPSYEDGKVRDPEVEKAQRAVAKQSDDQRSLLRSMIKRAIRKL